LLSPTSSYARSRLGKGAAGHALQNAKLICCQRETAGLGDVPFVLDVFYEAAVECRLSAASLDLQVAGMGRKQARSVSIEWLEKNSRQTGYGSKKAKS